MTDGGATDVVLDASALVAFLLGEPGADAVSAILHARRTAATPLALAETLRTCRRKDFVMTPDEIRTLLHSLGLHVEPVAEDDIAAIEAAFAASDGFRAGDRSRGSLSLADAACIAVARRLGAPVVVSDVYWDNLAIDDVQVVQFR